MFGSHLSVAGGLHNALLLAEHFGMQTVQVFTRNQQQWAAKPLSELEVSLWQTEAKRLRFRKTVSHASYLINLASPDETLWRKSVAAFTEEVRRCDALGIAYAVIHPGAHLDCGEDKGLARVVAAVDEVIAAAGADSRTTICLEVTAGQGSCLGHRLEHLAEVMQRVRRPQRLGVCLDTAHLFAAGYDFRDARYPEFRKQLQATVGLRSVKVWHLNDSKKGLGSRVDRHDHIGEGCIGLGGFRPIVNDSAFASTPKILETPKEKTADGRDWDAVNLERLRELVQ
jgi:deoxyribonuclease-4